MIPKIVVGEIDKNIDLSMVLQLDVADLDIADFRLEFNKLANISRSRKMDLLLWNADNLSPESQSLLLKPLEESDNETQMYLVVKNENKLLSTIISRCLLVDGIKEPFNEGVYWKKVFKCFTDGPERIFELMEEIPEENFGLVIDEVIMKLSGGLGTTVNDKRLKVLELSLKARKYLDFKGVNKKGVMFDYLFETWRVSSLKGS